jgi:hypothetical protein
LPLLLSPSNSPANHPQPIHPIGTKPTSVYRLSPTQIVLQSVDNLKSDYLDHIQRITSLIEDAYISEPLNLWSPSPSLPYHRSLHPFDAACSETNLAKLLPLASLPPCQSEYHKLVYFSSLPSVQS